MAINRIDIKGYKSLKEVSWEPARLNVLIGPNGSGKSNLLRALDLLRTAATGGLGQAVLDQGGIAPLVWNGIAGAPIEWCVKWAPEQDADKKTLTYKLALARIGNASSYRIEHELLGNYHRVETGEQPEPLKFVERTASRAYVYDQQERGLQVPHGTVPDEETLLSLTSAPFGNPITVAFRQQLAEWAIYHDLRVDAHAPSRQAVVTRWERRLDPDGQNLVQVLHTLYTNEREFEEEVNAAMKAAFGDEFDDLSFAPAEDQRIQLRVRWRSLSRGQPAANLSDGTLRFLSLLAILANPQPPSLIAIDEPEAGLHPSMFPIIADYAVQASDRTQVILTTHSPEFLSAFEDEVPKTVVAQCEEGHTRLRVIEGDELKRWLEEYSLGHLFRSGHLESMA